MKLKQRIRQFNFVEHYFMTIFNSSITDLSFDLHLRVLSKINHGAPGSIKISLSYFFLPQCDVLVTTNGW